MLRIIFWMAITSGTLNMIVWVIWGKTAGGGLSGPYSYLTGGRKVEVFAKATALIFILGILIVVGYGLAIRA